MKKLIDEDYAYEQYRQRKLDEELVIGSALKDCDKIQKFAHTDPAPHLPFEEDKEFVHAGIALVCVGVVIALLAVLWGYS